MATSSTLPEGNDGSPGSADDPSQSSGQRFHRREHLRLRRDFARVFAAKRSTGDELLIVHVAHNGLDFSRLGISVSKRIGNAVRRNYARRRIRETFRTEKAVLPQGLDIVCVARPEAAKHRTDLGESLRTLVKRAAQRRGKPASSA